MRSNGTWCLVELPKGRKALKNKWVFKIKYADSVERYKVSLAIKGLSQVKGMDYSETYSPVVRYAVAVRHLTPSRATESSCLPNAFLQGGLVDKEMYMEQLEGFRDDAAPRKDCSLKKSLYGLKTGKHSLENLAGSNTQANRSKEFEV